MQAWQDPRRLDPRCRRRSEADAKIGGAEDTTGALATGGAEGLVELGHAEDVVGAPASGGAEGLVELGRPAIGGAEDRVGVRILGNFEHNLISN